MAEAVMTGGKKAQATRADAPDIARHAHWLLRGGLAAVFIFHGLDKFTGAGVGGFAQAMGLPYIIGLMVALGEIGAGTALLIGGAIRNFYGEVLTRLGGLGVFSIMTGAIFMVHWGQWHFMATATHPMGGMEFQVTLMLVGIYMFIKGNAR